MITELNSKWRDVITNPDDYIDDSQDLALIKITSTFASDNPTLLMVGYDGTSYYVVVEDNYYSGDVYPEGDDTLMDTFLNVYARFVEIDELFTTLYESSQEANINLVFTDDNDSKVTPSAEALKLFNDILEKSCLPAMTELIVDNCYLNEDAVDIEANTKAITELLNEAFVNENIVFTYRSDDGTEIDMNADGVEVMKLILKSAYIPFVAKISFEIIFLNVLSLEFKA